MSHLLSPRLTDDLIQAIYFIAALLFIIGLKRMSSPKGAKNGIIWAGVGMLIAGLITFLWPGMHNYILIIVAIFIGGVAAWWSGRVVPMTAMPQMVALYNGMGGGAAAAIACQELIRGKPFATAEVVLTVIGAIIGAVSFSGSLIAFAKLQGLIKKSLRYRVQQYVNALLLAVTVALGIWIMVVHGNPAWYIVLPFFVVALAFGILVTLPIGGADMPVVISLYNACTGLAVAFEGFALQNAAMIIAGMLVGAAGTLLTQLMAKAMNRSIANVLFSNFGEVAAAGSGEIAGSLKPIDAADAGTMMAYAGKVIIVPGYGMAVAQAQHKIWELTQLLQHRDVTVKFAIHPVAGRMPGHMNVLLAEAGVPYDLIGDLEEINPEFPTADVALVIGANDVVNPDARNKQDSPIYGMPILNVDKAKNVIIIKRGQGRGFSGIENALFYMDQTRMFYGDGQEAVTRLIQAIKSLE
ncbi:MAG: NAD(P)(+) transhydrogenase (Re/Si-specific) subunit beta [Gammaproteobacteria bacterium]|nr:NAD(P)(+) transhydrogenase (Re/Si-specific) subunit beta [Gammaproteobacteria bacterium]